MSRETFMKLCHELRPFLEKQTTAMRSPFSVERQVVSTLYYLQDEGRLRKVANSFGIGKSITSAKVRGSLQSYYCKSESKIYKASFMVAANMEHDDASLRLEISVFLVKHENVPYLNVDSKYRKQLFIHLKRYSRYSLKSFVEIRRYQAS